MRRKAGPETAARIDWVHADLIGWDAGAPRYDLVSSQYIHLPPGDRAALLRSLAGAVVPGGMLLIVGHHPSDLQTTMPRPPMPELFFTGEDIAALLDPGAWKIITGEGTLRPRPGRASHHDQGHRVPGPARRLESTHT